VTEPTLEFIGQRLKTLQDEQHAIRSDIRMLATRLDMMVDRMDRMTDRMESMLQLLERLVSEPKP
jgi:hypothetical protein